MIDLIKFVARGALGGAIFPVLLMIGLSIPLGPALALVILVALSYWYLIPGAVVGLALWLIARFGNRLPASVRFGVGTLIPFATLFGAFLMSLTSASIELESLPASVAVVVLIAILSSAIGGIAGLACPDGLSRKKEPKLNYWERVALYEMAEREALVARARFQTRPDFVKKPSALR